MFTDRKIDEAFFRLGGAEKMMMTSYPERLARNARDSLNQIAALSLRNASSARVSIGEAGAQDRLLLRCMLM